MDHQLEVLRTARGFEGFLIVYAVLFDQLQQGLIEGLHTVVFALCDRLVDLTCLSRVHDEFLYTSGLQHHLAGSDASAVLRPDQALTDDPFEGAGEHGPHLPRSCGGKRSIMRLTVSVASTVWSVVRTRRPVSAAETGLSGHSRSPGS